MAKKSKMAPDAPVVDVVAPAGVSDAAAPAADAPAADAPVADAPEGDAPAADAPVADAVPAAVSKRASLTLKSAMSGASFTFNVRPESRMKGGAVGPTVSVDGVEIETKMSSNERLAAEGRTLWRIWITLPNGLFGYVITMPGETVDAFLEANGSEFATESGRASRPDPKRELAKPIVRKAAAPAEPEPSPMEESADAAAEANAEATGEVAGE